MDIGFLRGSLGAVGWGFLMFLLPGARSRPPRRPAQTALNVLTATRGGLEITGNVSSVLRDAATGGLANCAQIINVTGVAATTPEIALEASITSSAGAGNVNYYKVGGAFIATMNEGAAQSWAQTSILTQNSSVGSVGGTVAEFDLNNFNQAFAFDPTAASPSLTNVVVTGTHSSSCYATAGVSIGQGGSGPQWDVGLTMGIQGFNNFNTASIWDCGISPISLKITGSHSGGAIFVDAVSSGGPAVLFFNTHNTAGDIGIDLGVGSTGAADITTAYINFLTPDGANTAGTITRAVALCAS